MVRVPSRGRRLTLCGRAAVVALAVLLGGMAVDAQGQPAPVASPAPSVTGRWEGRLGANGLRLLLDVTKTVDGLYFATLTSIDQGGARLPIDRVAVAGDAVQLEIRSARVTYAGEVSPDRTRLSGTWAQAGREQRLEFARATSPVAAEPVANAASLFGVAAELAVSVPPTPFAAAGRRHLVYEIHVSNHSGVEMLLTRLEVLGAAKLGSWEGAALHAIVSQRRPNVSDARAIPAGGWAVVHVWVTMDAAAPPPRALRHRLTVGDRTLEGSVAASRTEPLVLGPPLRGGVWVAANGPGDDGLRHRRALMPINGRAYIAQRFATDWARVGPDGRAFEGDEKVNASYFGYGAEVLAVANGVVASIKDGIPDNPAGGGALRSADEGSKLRAVPMTLETIGGNHVILELGQGRYAFYGHLAPGSLRVKTGDRVRRGEVIARVGNSGNSTGPHLHFHVADRNHPLAAEGLPYAIDSWELRTPEGWGRRANEMPMRDARVRFPER